MGIHAWYAEFLLGIDLKILLRKTEARLIFNIALKSLHIDLSSLSIALYDPCQ
jgi:hypothetical protein